MDTTEIQDHGPAPVLFLVLGVVVVYKIFRWVLRWRLVGRASQIIDSFDSHVDGLDEVMLMARGGVPQPGGVGTGTPGSRMLRVRAQRLRQISDAVAHEAYAQFGHRPRSEANLLITRKFMRDKLQSYVDLRAKDIGTAIDQALYLSFLPSIALKEANSVDRTWVFEVRAMDFEGGSWGIFAWAWRLMPEGVRSLFRRGRAMA